MATFTRATFSLRFWSGKGSKKSPVILVFHKLLEYIQHMRVSVNSVSKFACTIYFKSVFIPQSCDKAKECQYSSCWYEGDAVTL